MPVSFNILLFHFHEELDSRIDSLCGVLHKSLLTERTTEVVSVRKTKGRNMSLMIAD